MKVYIVKNSDETVLGVFTEQEKAKKFIEKYGKGIWKENWTISKFKLNKIKSWIKKIE